MRLLMKFFEKEEYAKSFLKGNLYMNSLSYFWENGFEDQRDMLEGLSGELKAKFITQFEQEFEKHRITDYMVQYTGYKYCNLFCMTQLKLNPSENNLQFDWDEQMKKFGKYIAIITDEAEFLKRIDKAMKVNNLNYYCGDVEYIKVPFKDCISLNSNSLVFHKSSHLQHSTRIVSSLKSRDSFNKYDKFAWQKEWRICICCGDRNTNPYTLKIKPINDIAVMLNINNLNSDMLNKIFNKSNKIKSPKNQGNISREDLKNQLIKLDNYQFDTYFAYDK